MSRIQTFQKDLEREIVTTRKMLERVPDDKFDWQPHPKSMTVRRLAGHIAELPGWISMVFDTTELDFTNNNYHPRTVNNNAELMAYLEESIASARQHLAQGKEESLDEPWTLRVGEKIISVEPKEDVIRMSLNQIVHHRAQLGVFLRLLEIPIPGSYGPSADEMEAQEGMKSE